MKLEKLIEINKKLHNFKDSNKQFTFTVCEKFLKILVDTDKIIDDENKILTDFILENGQFDGYEYTIVDENLKSKYNELNNKDINYEIDFIHKSDFENCLIDLTTMELIKYIKNEI